MSRFTLGLFALLLVAGCSGGSSMLPAQPTQVRTLSSQVAPAPTATPYYRIPVLGDSTVAQMAGVQYFPQALSLVSGHTVSWMDAGAGSTYVSQWADLFANGVCDAQTAQSQCQVMQRGVAAITSMQANYVLFPSGTNDGAWPRYTSDVAYKGYLQTICAGINARGAVCLLTYDPWTTEPEHDCMISPVTIREGPQPLVPALAPPPAPACSSLPKSVYQAWQSKNVGNGYHDVIKGLDNGTTIRAVAQDDVDGFDVYHDTQQNPQDMRDQFHQNDAGLHILANDWANEIFAIAP